MNPPHAQSKKRLDGKPLRCPATAEYVSLRTVRCWVGGSPSAVQVCRVLYKKESTTREGAGGAPMHRSCPLTQPRPEIRIRGSFFAEGYPSGQREQTVNLPAYAFVGSNPTPSTNRARAVGAGGYCGGRCGDRSAGPLAGSLLVVVFLAGMAGVVQW